VDPKIVRLAPDVADVYPNRGLIRLDEMKLSQAISDFDKAISLKPNHAENYFQRGTVSLIDSNYSAAIVDLTRCIQLNSKKTGDKGF
jgi:tetratricopeptide (TPR) repeat protein